MVVVVKTDHLPTLLRNLMEYFPQSLKVYGEVRVNLSGNWPGVSFYADQWPDFNVIISKADPSKTKCPYVNNIHSVFSKDDTILMNMLVEPKIVNWKEHFVFAALDMELSKIIVMAANQFGAVVHIDNVCDWMQADINSLVVTPPNDDVTLESLLPTRKTVKLIHRHWQYAKPGADKFIKSLIETCPSRCLYDKKGIMIGCAIGQQYGTLGMLFVKPEYRKRGYGQVIMSQLANIYVSKGELANVCIEKANAISRKFHQKMGFNLINFTVAWIRIIPKDHLQCVCTFGFI